VYILQHEPKQLAKSDGSSRNQVHFKNKHNMQLVNIARKTTQPQALLGTGHFHLKGKIYKVTILICWGKKKTGTL